MQGAKGNAEQVFARSQRLAQTSRESTQRDMSDLVQKGVLRSVGAGRSTRYELLES